jgi:hypothetical protein
MLMVRGFVLIAGLATLIVAGRADGQPGAIDGARRADRTEVAYRFACGNLRTDFSFRQEWRELASVNDEVGRALGVRLTALVVPGRRIGASGLASVRALVRSFAWIDTVTATCSGGEVTLSVHGMELAAWLASFRGNAGGWQRPASVTRTIRISPRGGVLIS